MTTAEAKSRTYADKRLREVDPELAQTSYRRETKMKVAIFTGADIEKAHQDGYRQAVIDVKDKAALLVTQHISRK